MLVIVGNKQYCVRWSHVTPNAPDILRAGANSIGASFCSIEELLPGKERRFEAAGQAFCSPKDQFCKETGRKVSLMKALRGWERPERRLVWEAYWKMKGGSGK